MNKVMLLAGGHIAANLAFGIMLIFLPVFAELGATGGFVYDTTVLSRTNASLSPDISAGGETEDSGAADYRVLDMLSLGIFARMLDWADNLMFGLYNMLYSMLGGLMSTTQRTFLFGSLKLVIVFLYALTAVYWLTGRKPMESA